MVGAKLVLSADYRPQQMCDLFRDEGVTHSAGVPTVWLGMIDHIERTGDQLGPLKSVTIGGSAAPRAMVEWFRRKGVRIGHAWGMTEMSPIGTCGNPPANWDDMTDEEQVDFTCRQGRIPFGVELRIVDDEPAVGGHVFRLVSMDELPDPVLRVDRGGRHRKSGAPDVMAA